MNFAEDVAEKLRIKILEDQVRRLKKSDSDKFLLDKKLEGFTDEHLKILLGIRKAKCKTHSN